MKKEPLKTIKIETIDSLETYLWNLGLMSISIQTLIKLQERAEAIGIFDDDETECSKTLKYQVEKVFVCVNDLLKMCTSRTKLEWSVLMKKVIEANTKPPKKKGKKK